MNYLVQVISALRIAVKWFSLEVCTTIPASGLGRGLLDGILANMQHYPKNRFESARPLPFTPGMDGTVAWPQLYRHAGRYFIYADSFLAYRYATQYHFEIIAAISV